MNNNNSTWFFAVVWLALLSGCAATPKEQQATVNETDTNLLYDGDAKVLYEAKHKVETSSQALELGRQAQQAGDIDRALYHYVRAYELDPSQYEILHQVGTIHSLRGNADRAALAFGLVLKANPDHPQALTEQGLLEIGNKRYALAQTHLERAVAHDPRLWRAFNGLGIIADLRRDVSSAQVHYEEALRLNPRSPVLLNNFGYSKYLAGDWQGARKQFQKALDMDPGYRRARLNLGLIHARQGAYDQALAVFGRIMDRARACERVGSLAMLEGNYDVAEKYFNLAIDLSPTYFKDAFDQLEALDALRSRGEDHDAPSTAVDYQVGALAPDEPVAAPPQRRLAAAGTGLDPGRLQLYKPSGVRTRSPSRPISDAEFSDYLRQLSSTDHEVSLKVGLSLRQTLPETSDPAATAIQ